MLMLCRASSVSCTSAVTSPALTASKASIRTSRATCVASRPTCLCNCSRFCSHPGRRGLQLLLGIVHQSSKHISVGGAVGSAFLFSLSSLSSSIISALPGGSPTACLASQWLTENGNDCPAQALVCRVAKLLGQSSRNSASSRTECADEAMCEAQNFV